MKKNTILLLAGVCTLMTGCGGTKYTQENTLDKQGVKATVKDVLTLKTESFKWVQETTMGIEDSPLGSFESYVKFVYSGAAEQTDVENTYKLTVEKLVVSGYKCEGDAANVGNLGMETSFSLMFDEATVDAIMDGKKVIIENAAEVFAPTYVVVNPEEKTFTGVL